MPRYFTVFDAERLLPEVERLLRDALFQRSEAVKARQDLAEASDRIRMLGGMRVNPGPIRAAQARLDTSAAALKDLIDQVHETGALVKDLDIGLIDFLSRFENRDVCLCWKLGESGIGFWHGVEEGFRGRKPIDQTFLDGHSAGDSLRLN